jgi:hypothetical protein
MINIAAKFNIPARTVSTILKIKAEIIKLVENAGETCTNNKQHQCIIMYYSVENTPNGTYRHLNLLQAFVEQCGNKR